MDVNSRDRTAVAGAIGDQVVDAIVAFSHRSGGWANGDGVVSGGSSTLASRYAIERGIDLDDPRLRGNLLQSWCALTSTELAFFKPNPWAVRPKPGKEIERIDRAGVALRWVDVTGLSTVTRMIHLEFPDGTHLLTSTLVRAKVRRKNYNDEPDLFVRSFGQAATRLTELENGRSRSLDPLADPP